MAMSPRKMMACGGAVKKMRGGGMVSIVQPCEVALSEQVTSSHAGSGGGESGGGGSDPCAFGGFALENV